MQSVIKILEASSFTNYSSPIEILPECNSTEFFVVDRIIWKYKFGTSGFNYSDKLIFELGSERITTLQADSLSSLSSIVCVSTSNLCIDKECPRIDLGSSLKLKLLGTPPNQGDGEVIIVAHYYMDDLNRIYY